MAWIVKFSGAEGTSPYFIPYSPTESNLYVDTVPLGYTYYSDEDYETLMATFTSAVSEKKEEYVLEKERVKRVTNLIRRTEELLENGYTFESKDYSIAHNEQTCLFAEYIMAQSGVVSWPVSYVYSKDGVLKEHTNMSHFLDHFDVAMARLRTVNSAHAALLTNIKAATTIAALDAIVDNRT